MTSKEVKRTAVGQPKVLPFAKPAFVGGSSNSGMPRSQGRKGAPSGLATTGFSFEFEMATPVARAQDAAAARSLPALCQNLGGLHLLT